MSSHSTEPLLIGSVVALTVTAGYFLLRNAEGSVYQKSEKILTGFLGAFMFMGGSVKFFEPFTSMFANQIALSSLPFPTFSNWAGQFGEICSGLALLALLFFGKRLPSNFFDLFFYLVHILITVIMLVAVYVHLHPDVPAETLPLGTKPPYLTLFVLMLTGMNIWLHRRNRWL